MENSRNFTIYIGIIISHYRDPYEPIQDFNECHVRVQRCHCSPGTREGVMFVKRTSATPISPLRTTRCRFEIFAQYPVVFVMVLKAAHGSLGEEPELGTQTNITKT